LSLSSQGFFFNNMPSHCSVITHSCKMTLVKLLVSVIVAFISVAFLAANIVGPAGRIVSSVTNNEIRFMFRDANHASNF
jgi:hypothetical protein